MPQLRTDRQPFKPRARMLLLLGDQLIRDPGIAVFELVKNAYDADSPDTTVTMTRVDDREAGRIVVEDRGTGMDFDTVMGVWLEPGTDYRAQQKMAGERSPKYGRLPLGEKGVGRFAAHKLGNHIKLITRKTNAPEVVVEIDWIEDFRGKKYLKDVPITVRERIPQHFTGRKKGTRIEITNLRSTWTKGMVRELARAVNSICSPFGGEGDFRAALTVTDKPKWLEGILNVDEILDFALFYARCELDGEKLSYTYSFTPYKAMSSQVKARREKREGKNALTISRPKGEVIDLNDYHIGPVGIDLYVFDRDAQILELGAIKDKKGLREYLNESGGVKVYRDDIRVYDYGERGNDWLGLDEKRINRPGIRLSNNLIVGAVSLDLASSLDLRRERGLVEKTNREGFVDNADFRAFRDAVYYAISQIETEREKDKKRIRDAYSNKNLKEPVLEDLRELRRIVERKNLGKELNPYLDRIEKDFLLIKERFLVSASAGLSLSVVIHEVEKGVEELLNAVRKENASQRVQGLAKHIADLVEGFGALVQKSGDDTVKASSMITQALFNTELRLEVHGIKPVVDNRQGDFEVKCSRRLLVSTLMNLIDNSIWWLDNKWGRAENKKRIYVGTSTEFVEGPAIVVADNGPGFIDTPEYLVEPFISRKPDGMGLGLHIADQVMKSQGGRLVFPDKGDVSVPPGFNGAVVALVFGEANK